MKAENPFMHLNLTLADLCHLGGLKGPAEIRPEHAPLLTEVESTVERNSQTGTSKTISKYCLAFPGSKFLKVLVKVEESTPSISQEAIDKCGGAVRVDIRGFTSGTFESNGGGARPYFRATSIVPAQNK